VVANFCHYVHFFHSSKAGENWISEHPGTFLLSIADAYDLDKGKNAAQYKEALAPEPSMRANADESSVTGTGGAVAENKNNKLRSQR